MSLLKFFAGVFSTITLKKCREQWKAEAEGAEADAKAQAEAAEADAKAQADARAKAQAEAQAEAAEADAKAQADARAKAQAEAQAEAQAKAEALKKAQAEAQAEARAQEKAEAEAREKADYIDMMTRRTVFEKYLHNQTLGYSFKIVEELLAHFHEKYPDTFKERIHPFDFTDLISSNPLYQKEMDTFFSLKKEAQMKDLQLKYKAMDEMPFWKQLVKYNCVTVFKK
jgi:ATP-dependent exoDNAse (exonuclease V) beta subunit